MTDLRYQARGVVVAACLLAAGQAAGWPMPSMDRSMIPADMPADVRRWVEDLYHENDARCSQAAQALREMGPSAVSAAPFLASVLHGHYSLRTANTAAKALVAIGPGAFEAAAAASSSGSGDAQRRAFHVITLVDSERSAPVVFDAFGAGEASRGNLAFLRRGGETARALVLEALRSEDATLRVRAVRALPAFTSLPVSYRDVSGIENENGVVGHFNTQETVDLLTAAATDSDRAVRVGALDSLVLIAPCPDKKLPLGDFLRKALADSEATVRLAAIEVAVRLDEPAAARIEALAPLAADPDPAVRAKLADRVMRLPARHGPFPTFPGEETRLRPLLLGLLGDPSEKVREEAVRGLGDVRAFQAVETIAKMLDDPRRETIIAAAGALGRIGGVASADALLAKEKTETEQAIRLEIVESLSAICRRHFAVSRKPRGSESSELPPDALDAARVDAIFEAMAKAMREPMHLFHWPAVQVLLETPPLAGRDTVPALLLAIESPDGRARAAVHQALLRGTLRDERLLEGARECVRKGIGASDKHNYLYEALGKTNDLRNVAALETAAKRGGVNDGDYAADVLFRMGEAGVHAALRSWRIAGSGNGAAEILRKHLRDPGIRQVVESALRSADEPLQKGAQRALDLADGKAASSAGPPDAAPPASAKTTASSTNAIRTAGAPPVAGLQLVEVSSTHQDRFLEIGGWIQSKQYEPAVEALHALLASGTETGFYPLEGDRSRYVAVGSAATRLLAAFPDDALELYSRRRDLAARDRLEAAAKADEEGAYEAVGERYFHTGSGARALQRSAALALDHGRPLRAAATWEALGFLHRGTAAERAAWIGKACAAYHLAGARDKAAAMLEAIRKDHPSAETAVAGRIVRWQAFLEDLVKAAPASPPAVAEGTKAGAGAAPVLLWTGNDALRGSFVGELPGLGGSRGAGGNRGPSVTFESGRVRVARPPIEFDLPSLVHPVAMEGMALCRRESAIVATALDSGAELWRVRDLPLHRPQPESWSGGRSRWIMMAGDMGRYALGLGDCTVYALSHLAPLGDHAEGAGTDGGSLTALAVSREGARTIWKIGNGKGDHPSTREAKCLTVPTVHAGRLYALARMGNRYVALCLDAATGNLVWERPLGVIPMRGGAEFSALQACAVEMVTERGSPPAVAGGIAVFLTNSGVLAGLDAATGAPVWAHRYDSRVSGAAAGQATVTAQGQALLLTTLRRPYFAANPVLLDQDRVICLPCDSDFVLALHARTGELLWRRERGGQEELTAAGDSRLLLTGPDMAVLRAEDGTVLHRREAAILGRPTVAGGQVFASGKGSVLHVDLAGFAVSETPVGDGKADLGNLTAAPGCLIAAHAGGLCAWGVPGIFLPRQPGNPDFMRRGGE